MNSIPLQPITPNAEEEVDVITGWLYNGPLQRAKYQDFSTIDWIYDNTKARHQKTDLKNRIRHKSLLRGQLELLWDASEPWVILLAVGVAMGLIATFVAVASQWLIDFRQGHCRTGFYLNRRFCCWNSDAVCLDWVTWSEQLKVRWRWLEWVMQYLMFLVTAIVFSGASTYLVTELAPYAVGQGIAEIKTIMSGFMMRGFLGFRTLGVKVLGVVLAVASGLSLGKEGTLVHVACCLSNVFYGREGNEVGRRELLSAASAAGISVAFGSPIAGVLFSLEQVSYYFPAKTMWRSLFCAAAAAVTLKLCDPFRNGKLVSFQVTYDRTLDLFELWLFVMIGWLCGAVGTWQNRLAHWLIAYRQRTVLRNFARGEVVVAALATGLVSYFSVYLRADPVTLVSNLFTECTDAEALCSEEDRLANVVALVATAMIRVGMTAVACGLAVPAGMFIPSMATGAGLGRAVGMVVQMWQERHPHLWLFRSCSPDVPCITPGVYALVGAASMLASTTRMTVTVVVIVLELTGAMIYLLPIMLAVTVSKSVADAMEKDGFFEGIINLHGYPFLTLDREYRLAGDCNEHMVEASVMAVAESEGLTMRSVKGLLGTTYSGFPVVRSRSSMALVGYISRSDLELAAERARSSGMYEDEAPCLVAGSMDSSGAVDLRPWVDLTPIALAHSTDINEVAEVFRQLGVRYVLVVHQGALLGIITKKDIVQAVRMQSKNNERQSVVSRFEETLANSNWRWFNRSN